MLRDPAQPLRLFLSYAQADAELRNQLEKHLSSLRRQKLISIWDESKINPGSEWQQERTVHLNAAHIILLLISPDFIASEECYSDMQQALAKHSTGTAHVIPILLRPVDLENAPFHILQSLPTNGEPIIRWQPHDDAFQNVVKGIRNVVAELIKSEHIETSNQTDNSLKDSSSQYNAARSRYLENVYKRYSSVRLPLGPAEGFSLQAIFQPLTLRRDPSTAENLRRNVRSILLGESTKFKSLAQNQENRTEYKEPVTMIVENGEEALKSSPQGRMVILGGPGTGKTITLKYLVGVRARHAMVDPTAPVPIFLSLTGLVRSGKTLQHYLINIVEDMEVESRYADFLWRDIETGRAFICLDSLDEVASQHRVEIIELINIWASRAGNTWIIGSRFTEYKGGQFKQEQFTEWELLPMNHSMRLQLSQRLFPELVRLLSSTNTTLSPENFVSLLEHHPHAAAWGENPLLFSLAAVVVLQTGGLPSCRAALYHEVVEAILQTREHDQFWCSILMRMLTKLALWLHQLKGRTFTRNDLLTFFLDVEGKSLAETTELARRTLSSGIIEVVAHNTYSFRHQTFQEYLAAAELAYLLVDRESRVREDSWHLAWSKRTYSRWTEVLRLMVGILVQTREKRGREIAQSWIRALLEQRTTKEGDPGNLGLMLALRSLAEVSEIAGWETLGTIALEESIISKWIDELHDAASHNRNAQKLNLARLSYDISHLRKPLLETVLKQISTKTCESDSQVASVVLQFLGENVPLEPLVIAFQTGDPDVRAAAVRGLARQGERVPIKLLILALKDESEKVRESAIKALDDQEERVPVEVLISALKDTSRDVRMAVVKALTRQRERVPVEVLISTFNNSKDTSKKENMTREQQNMVRQAVLKVLGAFGERVPIELLVSNLNDEIEDVRKMAVEVLGNQIERTSLDILISAFNDNSGKVRIAVLKSLSYQGEKAPIEILVSALKDTSRDVRISAVKALAMQGERMPAEVLLETLISARDIEDRFLREEIVNALSGIDGQVPVIPLDKLVLALHDVNENVREAVVHVLGSQGERVPIEVLVSAFKDESRLVREAVVHVLGSQGERVPIEVLLAALQDKNGFVREATVRALGVQGKRVPTEVLVAILQDQDKFMRRAAAQSLIGQGERVPLDILMKALEDEDRDIRRLMIQVIRKIDPESLSNTPPEALSVLQRQPVGMVFNSLIQGFVARASDDLGRSLQSLLKTLEQLLDWPDTQVRVRAIRVLGKIRRYIPDSTIQQLLKLRHDHDPTISAAADDTLAEILSLETGIEDD